MSSDGSGGDESGSEGAESADDKEEANAPPPQQGERATRASAKKGFARRSTLDASNLFSVQEKSDNRQSNRKSQNGEDDDDDEDESESEEDELSMEMEEESEEEVYSEEDLSQHTGTDYAEEDDGGAMAGDDEMETETEIMTMTSVSNETERSDLADFDTTRQTAQVVPEAPWAGTLKHIWQCMFAVLLPLILVLLMIYAFFKMLQGCCQLFSDLWIVTRQLVWLAIRVAFSPIYFAWKLFVPKTIQDLVAAEFERRIGKHLRKMMNFYVFVRDKISDLPNICAACLKAAIETCIVPAKNLLDICCWKLIGQYMAKWVSQPLIDSHVNRTIARKRRMAGFDKKQDDMKKSTLLMNESRARKQRLAVRDRQRRARMKKRYESLDIKLSLETHRSGKPHEHRVQLADKSRDQLVSRTMVVERRYAIAIGFVWCLIGLSLLLLVLDGTEGERCTICEDNEDLAVRVCRHGRGRDCAFHYHSGQVFVSVCVIGIGLLLIFYSVFLYRPANIASQKHAEDQQRKKEVMERQFEKGMENDPDVLAAHMMKESLAAFSLPRFLRNVYRASPAATFQRSLTNCMVGWVVWPLVKWEMRNNLQKRSIQMQYAFYMMAGGWLLAAKKWIQGRLKKFRKRIWGDPEPNAHETYSRMCLLFSSACVIGTCCCCLFETNCGQKCLESLRRTRPAQMFLALVGLDNQIAESARRSMVNTRGRSAGSGMGSIEQILERFGLDERDPEEVAIDLKKKQEEEEARATEERKIALQEMTSGLAETQREAGLFNHEYELEDELEELGLVEFDIVIDQADEEPDENEADDSDSSRRSSNRS